MTTDQFKIQLPWFLKDVPGTACPKAGKAAYSDAVRTENSTVIANNFFAFHTVLKTSEDYYEAMRWARRLADNLTVTLNQNISETDQQVNVFPYSVFYVFYEQYLTMVEDTATSLGISLSAVFVVTFVLGGLDIKTAIVTVFLILLILVSILVAYISLNTLLCFTDQFDWYDVLVVGHTQCHFFSQSCHGQWNQCGILFTYHQRFRSQFKTGKNLCMDGIHELKKCFVTDKS